MIPQNIKDIISHSSGLLQSIAMILFIIFFVGLVYFVINKPKNYFEEEAKLPINDNENF